MLDSGGPGKPSVFRGPSMVMSRHLGVVFVEFGPPVLRRGRFRHRSREKACAVGAEQLDISCDEWNHEMGEQVPGNG